MERDGGCRMSLGARGRSQFLSRVKAILCCRVEHARVMSQVVPASLLEQEQPDSGVIPRVGCSLPSLGASSIDPS